MTNKTTFELTRRGFLGTAHGWRGRSSRPARPGGATKTLNVLSHKVHETVLGTGDNDLLKAWKASNDADVAFTTFDSNPLQDRLFREASLTETDYGVGFIIDNRPTSEIASLFEPLDDHLKKRSDRGFRRHRAGPGAGHDGRRQVDRHSRFATPRRVCSTTRRCWRRRAFRRPPTTLEELVEQAKKLTFTSKAGTPVTGMILASDLAVFPVMFARAFGGDFITKDFKLVPDPAAMEKALERCGPCSKPAPCRAATRRPRTTIRSPGCSRDGRPSPCCPLRAAPSSTIPTRASSRARSRPSSSRSRPRSRARRRWRRWSRPGAW